MAKPYHMEFAFNSVKKIHDHLMYKEFLRKEKGPDGTTRYVCTRPSVHGGSCKEGGYTSWKYARLHVMDQHLAAGSLRLHACVVCGEDFLQPVDLDRHMRRAHAEHVLLKKAYPAAWNALYGLLEEQELYRLCYHYSEVERVGEVMASTQGAAASRNLTVALMEGVEI